MNKSVFSRQRDEDSLVGSVVNNKFRPLKQLHDSDYVKPDQNEKVFQDTHPRKRATFNNALERFEQELKQKNNIQDLNLKDFRVKVKQDEDAVSTEKNTTKNKQ